MRGRALGPGRLWKRDKNWVLDFTDADGRRKRRVLGTDKRAAERRRLELIRRRDMELDGLGSVEGQSLLLSEVADQYLEDLQPRVTPRHYKNVSSRLEKTLTDLDGLRVRDLKPMHVVRIRSQATSGGASNRTANLIVQSLQAMLRWAVENQIVAQSPIDNVRPLPYTRDHHVYRRRPMTEDEIVRFLAASEEEDEDLDLASALAGLQRVPQTPMWMAFMETGARWNELRLATWGDLDLGRRLLTLRAENTKSRKQRVIPITEGLLDRLVGLRALQESVLGRLPNVEDRILLSPEGCPWSHETTNSRRIFDRLLQKAGIAKVDAQGEKLDIHALRTTCASRMARNGVPLVKAQKILGHSDPKLTAVHYVGLDVEDLRDAVVALDRGPMNKREAR